MAKATQKGRSATRFIPVILVVAAALITGYVFVAPGHPSTVDAWPHLARQKVVYESLKQGTLPTWTFMFYSGYPFLRFYSPVFYALTGLTTFLTGGSILAGLRLVLVLLQLASALLTYVFFKRRFASAFGAALGAIVCLLVPWRVRQFVDLAGYPQLAFYVLLPLALLCADRLVRRPSLRRALVLGLVLTLAPLSHVFYGLFLVGLVALFLVLSGPVPWRRLGLALAAFIGLTAFLFVPFLAGYRCHAYPQVQWGSPAPDIGVLLGFSRKLTGYSGDYLGLSILAVLILSVAFVLARRPKPDRTRLFLLLGLGISLVWVFVMPNLGDVGQTLEAGLPSERLFLFFFFFAGMSVAAGWSAFEQRLGRQPGWVRSLCALVLLAALFLDCLPWHLRRTYQPLDRLLAERGEAYGVIAGQNPTKTLDVFYPDEQVDFPPRLCLGASMGFLYGNLTSPLGPPYHQFAPKAMSYVYPWIAEIARDLGDEATEHISPATAKALALIGASHVIMQPRFFPGQEPGPGILLLKQGIDWDTRILDRRARDPLVFAPTGYGLCLAANRLRPMPEAGLERMSFLFVASDWHEVLDAVELDSTRENVLDAIPVPSGTPAESLPGEPVLQVVSSRVTHHDATVLLEASTACFLRLAVSYYPELQVRLDGSPVEFGETKDHFVWLRCPAGRHQVEVTAPLPPLRRVTLLASGLFLLAGLVGIALPGRRRRADSAHRGAGKHRHKRR